MADKLTGRAAVEAEIAECRKQYDHVVQLIQGYQTEADEWLCKAKALEFALSHFPAVPKDDSNAGGGEKPARARKKRNSAEMDTMAAAYAAGLVPERSAAQEDRE